MRKDGKNGGFQPGEGTWGTRGDSTHPKGCVGRRVGARWGSTVGTVDRPISAVQSLLPAWLPPKEGTAQQGGHGRSLTLAGRGGGMWTDVRGPSGRLQLLGGCRAVGVSKRSGGPASAGEGWRPSALLCGGEGVAHEVRGLWGWTHRRAWLRRGAGHVLLVSL